MPEQADLVRNSFMNAAAVFSVEKTHVLDIACDVDKAVILIVFFDHLSMIDVSEMQVRLLLQTNQFAQFVGTIVIVKLTLIEL